MVVKACGSTENNKKEQLSPIFSSQMQGGYVYVCVFTKNCVVYVSK